MNKNYKYTITDRILFIIKFILYKFQVLFLVKRGKISVLILELLWIVRPIMHFSAFINLPFIFNYYVTNRGKFYINKDLINGIVVSPTFEKDDMDYLLSSMEKNLKRRNRIAFIDIGAHFGIYTVTVGNLFKKQNVPIYSFEPNASNFHADNFSLLKKMLSLIK